MGGGVVQQKVAVRVCRFSVRCIKSKQNWFENCTRQGTHKQYPLFSSKRNCTSRKVRVFPFFARFLLNLLNDTY